MGSSSHLPNSYTNIGFKNITINHVPDTSTGPSTAVVMRLSRPDRLNAVTSDMLTEIETAYQLFEKDPRVRTIVLTGSGKAFCAGADLSIGFSGLFSQKQSAEGLKNFRDQ